MRNMNFSLKCLGSFFVFRTLITGFVSGSARGSTPTVSPAHRPHPLGSPEKCWLKERRTLRKASGSCSSVSCSGGVSMVSNRKEMYSSFHWSGGRGGREEILWFSILFSARLMFLEQVRIIVVTCSKMLSTIPVEYVLSKFWRNQSQNHQFFKHWRHTPYKLSKTGQITCIILPKCALV